MTFYSKLTRDYEDYLIRLVFGSKVETDPLSVCVDTAYLDFNRTLRGISKVKNGAKLHTDAVGVLTNSLAELKETLKTPTDQTMFDSWHDDTCAKLISVYNGCQGRSKTRPRQRSKSRPEELIKDWGLSGRRASGAEACAA